MSEISCRSQKTLKEACWEVTLEESLPKSVGLEADIGGIVLSAGGSERGTTGNGGGGNSSNWGGNEVGGVSVRCLDEYILDTGDAIIGALLWLVDDSASS